MRTRAASDDRELKPRRCALCKKGPYSKMLAVIGNVLAGGFVLGLFTATLRLTKPRKRA
jgi:hypothetical protein